MLDSEQGWNAQTLFSVLTLLDSDSGKKPIFNNFKPYFDLPGGTLSAASPGIAVKTVRHYEAPCFQPRGWAWFMLTSF